MRNSQFNAEIVKLDDSVLEFVEVSNHSDENKAFSQFACRIMRCKMSESLSILLLKIVPLTEYGNAKAEFANSYKLSTASLVILVITRAAQFQCEHANLHFCWITHISRTFCWHVGFRCWS